MRAKINFAITISVIIVISYFSLRPVSLEGSAGGINVFTFLHFIAYFFLAGSLLLHFHDNGKGHIYSVGAAFCFGLAIELLQTQIPSRFFSYGDIAVNFLGASLIMLDHHNRNITKIIEVEDQLLENLEEKILQT